ncbi:MFS transporter [Novosphingobium sp. KACC 22771]|uniref:MFS transporter n=1 Tax=Novosphingobium sp. KACC 22771 TaxID=3025670 RepID=UPI0023652B01|nr:MFS transporter [Novosphingobium sp. KACC 22771]WDF71619.1 MFS transporter [Novosphingobium sp. KACC 22771]
MEPTNPLQIADYRRFWTARFLSWLAGSGMVVIIGYQLYDLARQSYGMTIAQASFMLGVLGFVQFVPMLLLTPVSGVVSDRFDRRKVGAMSISVDMAMAFTLAITTWQGWLTLPLVLFLGMAHGTARVFVGPSVGAIAPMIVPPALLPRAIAMNSMAMQAGTITGPAVAGVLFGWHPSLFYWMAGVALCVSALSLLMIRPLPAHAENRRTHPMRMALEGLTFVRSNPFLLGCITLDLFAVLLGGATALLPVYARDILHVGPTGLGQMRAAPAVGAAVLGVILSIKPLERRVGITMLGSVALFGAATAVFAVSTHYALSLAMLAVLGAADMISMFVRSTLVQMHTPDAMRGRVSAISGLAVGASNELGEMESGIAAWLLGAQGAVLFGGIGAVVVTLLWAFLFPQIRKANRFTPQEDD